MARRKLRNTRPKALFGEAAATLTAAGITATAQLAAAGLSSKATTKAAKQQAQATIQAAQANAQALTEQNKNNNQLQQDSQSFTKEQNEESRQLQKDIQMNLQMLTGAQSAKDRREESKIQVRNGGLAKGKRKLTQSFLWGNNMPFTVTDGGGVIPIGQTPEGFNLYEVVGNDHEHYHKAQGGKNKTGVGFKFADGSVVEGEGNQRSSQGEYLLTTPTDAAFISKHSIDGFNPVQAVNAGMNPLQAFALQEQIKATNGISDDGKSNASSPVKKNGGISTATNNILQPYIIGDIAIRRTLRNGGRPQAGIGDFLSNIKNQIVQDASDVWNHRANNAVMMNLLLGGAADLFNPISEDRYVQVNLPQSDGSIVPVYVDPEGVGLSYTKPQFVDENGNATTANIRQNVEIDENGNIRNLPTEAGFRLSPSMMRGLRNVINPRMFQQNKAAMQRIIQQNVGRAQQTTARAMGMSRAEMANPNGINFGSPNNPNLIRGISETVNRPITYETLGRAFTTGGAQNAVNSVDRLRMLYDFSRAAAAKNLRGLAIRTGRTLRNAGANIIDNVGYGLYNIGNGFSSVGQSIGRGASNAWTWTKGEVDDIVKGLKSRVTARQTANAARNNAKAEAAAAGGSEAEIRAAGEQAARNANFTRKDIINRWEQMYGKKYPNWFMRHPVIGTGLGITSLGIGGTLGYNLASYNPETDGPINMGDLESSYNVTDSMHRASRQQRAVTNAATNDSTSTSTPAASTSVRTKSATTNSAPAVSAPTDSTSTKKAQTKSSKTVSDAQASSDAVANGDDKKFKNFNEAFDYYHEKYGDDGAFVFGGLTYGTKKEKDAKKEARNRRWGARRTEDSLAKILGDMSDMSDAQLWDVYLNRKDRTQTRNGGYVARVPFTVGGIATDAATMNSYGINPNFDTDTITPTVTGAAYAANNGMLPTQINNDDENQARNGKRIHRKLKNGGRVKAGNGWYQFAGAGVNSLGNIGGALISSYGNNKAAGYLSDAYNQAGNILSNAYNSLTGIDMSTLRKEDYAAAHAMANIRSANVNVNPQLEAVNRDARQQMRAVNRNTLSSAARLNRLGRISDTRQQRLNEIYASQENQEEQIKQQNAKTITDVANENANRDTEANKAYQSAYLNLLQYNNDINNERILGSAGAQADALTNSAGAIAQAKMSNANAWAGAISSTGESFANALTTVGKQNQDYENIMAGVDTGAKISAALNHFSNADKEYLREIYADLDPDNKFDAEYMSQIEKKMPELKGTNKGGNTPGTARPSLKTTRPVSYFQYDPNFV